MIKIKAVESESLTPNFPGIKIVASPGWIDRFVTITTSSNAANTIKIYSIRKLTSNLSGNLSVDTSSFKIGIRSPYFNPIVEPPVDTFFVHKIANTTFEEIGTLYNNIVSNVTSSGATLTIETSALLSVKTNSRKLRNNHAEISAGSKRRVIGANRREKRASIRAISNQIADSILPSISID